MTEATRDEDKFNLEISEREYDQAYEVVLNVSSARLGETDKELIKSRKAVDLRRNIQVFVGNTEQECKRWVKANMQLLKKYNTKYEFNG